MLRLILAMLLLAQGCGLPAADDEAAAPPTTVAGVETLALTFAEEHRIPGLALVVLRGDETLLARGYGVAEIDRSAPVAPSTVFQLGSLGKQFLAALVLLLVEDGLLSLEDPVAAHLPDFDHLPATVRVRHLLDHTSGIRELFMLEGYGAGIGDLGRGTDELVALARGAPLDFSPGCRWSYSNTNYTILALLVEHLTGMPYEEALRTRLFSPLGLGSLRQCTPLPREPGEARGYRRRRDAIVASPPENMHWIRGDGGLCGSASDVARWTRLLGAGRVLSAASLASMTAPARLADGRQADYGFALSLARPDGRRRIGHGGAMAGFSATAAYYPDEALTVVVLTNLGGLATESLERRIARLLLAVPSPELEPVEPSAAERARFLGLYDIGVFDVRVAERGGQLWLEMPPPGPTTRLSYLGDGELVGADDPDAVRVSFGHGAGPAEELRLLMAGMHWYGVRRSEPGLSTLDCGAMADLPPADAIRSKGFTLKGALAFVEEGYGPAQRELVVEALPAGSRELVRGTLLDGGWYPFRTQVDLYEAIDRVLGSGDLALCWEIGKFTSERELTTLHRLFLKVSSLDLWLRSAGVMWKRYYSAGALEVESMENERGAVRVVEFNPISKAFCFDFGGWLHRTLELNKRQEVRVAHPECVLDGAPACRYEATWRTGA